MFVGQQATRANINFIAAIVPEIPAALIADAPA